MILTAWNLSKVIAALGRFSATPLMKAGLMSMQTSLIASGSPPCVARSSANAATVSASRRRWCTFRTEGEVTPAREPLCDDALATNGDRASCLKHPIQNRDADGCLGLLGGEAACLQPRSDQCLVSAHRRFDQ